ncbi:hypothetical protein FRC12_007171 [Ceratobasidium sp. 428]|nr:hypothetical protein FRC12_007171 [Ceratobasidium sp. 428]
MASQQTPRGRPRLRYRSPGTVGLIYYYIATATEAMYKITTNLILTCVYLMLLVSSRQHKSPPCSTDADLNVTLQATLWGRREAMLSESGTSRSRPTALINRLPPEILAMIFTLASRRCITQKVTDLGPRLAMPTVFSSICSLWRRVSLSTRSLWSHLDISIDHSKSKLYYDRLKLWEARSRPGPLSVHILDAVASWDYDLLEAMATDIVSFLTPHMVRVSEVQITFRSRNFPNYMLDLLSLWARKGAAKPARVLKIGDQESVFERIDLRDRLSRTAKPVAIDDFESFFQPLHTLHLQRVFVPWDSSVYHGLVDLYITAGAHSPQHWLPTQSQLARVLAACPKLRSLRLIDFTVRPDRGFVPSPIIFDYLEVLSLLQPQSSDRACMKQVLPLIGSNTPLEAGLELFTEPDCAAITRSFFARCNVTRLYLSTKSLTARHILPFLAGHLPHLQALAIEFFDFTDGTTQRRMATPEANPTSDPWPQLRDLYMIRCILNSDHEQIRQLLRYHLVQKLYLLDCTRRYGTPGELRKEIEDIQRLGENLGVSEVVTKRPIAGHPASWNVV